MRMSVGYVHEAIVISRKFKVQKPSYWGIRWQFSVYANVTTMNIVRSMCWHWIFHCNNIQLPFGIHSHGINRRINRNLIVRDVWCVFNIHTYIYINQHKNFFVFTWIGYTAHRTTAIRAQNSHLKHKQIRTAHHHRRQTLKSRHQARQHRRQASNAVTNGTRIAITQAPPAAALQTTATAIRASHRRRPLMQKISKCSRKIQQLKCHINWWAINWIQLAVWHKRWPINCTWKWIVCTTQQPVWKRRPHWSGQHSRASNSIM